MARRKANIVNQGPNIEDNSLGGIISREIKTSQTYDQSQINTRRSRTLEYIRGIMTDLPGRTNGSQLVSRDISDVISWMLPGIMRTLTASDQMVRFELGRPGNEQWAEDATDYTNWSFFTENDGYRTLYNGTYDSLALGNGVVAPRYEPEQTRDELLTGQTIEQVAELLTDPDIRIVSQKPGAPKLGPTEMLGEVEVPTFDVKVQHIESRGRIYDQTCKPENLLINASATTLEDARFVAYLHDDWTRSDLLEMGFDPDLVDSLAPGPNFARNQVELSRRWELTTNWQSTVRSGDRIDTYECYLEADADGDGIAEMLQVWYAGTIGSGVVLGWDYWDDERPFTDIPCYPLPHRWDAESVADRTVEIQKGKTVLLRALMDSTYASVVPQRAVQEGSVLNPDALVNPRFGSTIWVKKGTDPNAAIAQQEVIYTGDKALAGMQALDEVITKRTGISRTTMALDPEALTNQTATAAQNLRDAGYSQVELVARNQSELGWRKYFAKRLKLAIKHGIIAQVPVRQPQPGQPSFKQIDASKWDASMAVSINTGLGTGSRDRDMAMLNVMMNGQVAMAQQLAQTGLPTARAKALQFLPKIINSAVLLAEAAGIKSPGEHYPDITDQDVQQMLGEAQQMAQQPNGEAQMLSLKMQGEMQAQQAASQIAQIKGQAEVAKAQYDLQTRAMQLENEKQQSALKDEIARLQVQLQAAKADADNATKLKTTAMQLQASLEVARINKGMDQETMAFSKYLDSLIGIQEHEQAKEMAAINAQNAAQQPTPLQSA